MRRITTCSFLVLMAVSISLTSADAAIVQILVDNPDATDADFAQSFIEFDECVAGGQSEQACYKVLWDPPFITEGVMTVDITPIHGDTSRIGRVLAVTEFNGYAGNGAFERIDLGDKVRFEIPVISVEAPPETDDGLDIVELQIADNGSGQAIYDFIISARDLKVLVRDDGTIDENPIIKPKNEILGVGIDLTPEQQVPVPNVDGFAPLGKASFNLSPVDPDTGLSNISINGSFTGLTSEPFSAALRGPAEVGEVADGILELEINSQDGTFGISGASLDATQRDYLMSGLTYLDIATVNNDAGEIRGQIIPEPSSACLLLLGLVALGWCRRGN